MGIICCSQKLLSPKEGPIYDMYYIFRYLQVNLKGNLVRVVFDGTLERSSESFFKLGPQDKEKWEDL